MAYEGSSSHQFRCNEDTEDYDTEINYSSSSYDNEETNVEDNGEEGCEGEGEGDCNLRKDTAVNNVEELLRIKFDDLSAEELTKYHFCDLNMAFMFYNWYASKKGFAARKCRIVRTSNGEIVQQTFVCHRQGIKVERRSMNVGKKRASRPTSRCGCEAKVQVHVESRSGRWYIKNLYDVHNHSFLHENFKGMLPAHRKMSEYDKYQMMLMRDVGIKTAQIYGYVAEQSGGFDKLGYMKRDMYNEQVKQKRTNFSDAKAAMDYLAGMCSDDSNMFFRHTVDEDGHLVNLFWCDGISRMDYSVFGDVLAFDATYKKVKYLTPFVVFSGVNHHNQSIIFAAGIVGDESEVTYIWMLEQFLEAMGGKSPVSVITDGDGQMRRAIAKVFPTAHHRLCAWHLLRNATTHVKNAQFVSKLKHCMFADMDVVEFNQKWEGMVQQFGLEENLWVLELYERRKMWATSCIRGNFFAGFRTTSRCEGLNSEFGKYVSVLSNLLDFVKHFFRWVEYMRYREFEADFASASYIEPVIQTQYRWLEKSGAAVFTKEIHKIFRKVLERASNCFVGGSTNNESIFLYTVCRYDKEGMEWEVSFCEMSLEFKCCCLRFESLGIPCEHILSVLLYLRIKQIPESLVMKRWSKCAKDGLTLPCSNKRVCRDHDFVSTYVGIVERCKRMATVAVESGRPEFVRKLLEVISMYTSFFEGVGRGEDTDFPTPDPYRDGTLKNPVQARAKGCASSQKKSNKTPKKKASCKNCGKKGHNRRSCHSYRPLQFTQESEVGSSAFDEVDSDELEDANIYMSYE